MRPYKVLLFIAAVMACLAALCVVLPGRVAWEEKELRWPTLVEVLGSTEDGIQSTDLISLADSVVEPIDSIIPADTIVPEQPKPQPVYIPKVSVDSTTDSRVFLRAFYASLAQASERTVRVLHYGDSQIEEDRMSQQIREALQNKYGGSGVGLMPLAQTIPSRTVRQQLYMNGRFTMPAQGPRRYLVYGPKRDQRADGLYGVMGQVAVMNDSLVRGSEEIMAVCTQQDGRKRYTRWQIFADPTISDSIAGDTVYLRGHGKVYGLSQESETGIIVDNIPMRGCLGTVFTKIDSAQLTTFYREQNVRLIIMQFGGNAIPFNEKPETIRGFIKGYREQIRYLRQCAPQADILFIGPSDMMRMKDGVWQSYPMVAYMDKLLRKMCLEENIAYFSLNNWMGGAGSMLRWKENGLAGNDGIHFTRKGAKKAGQAISDWILNGLD